MGDHHHHGHGTVEIPAGQPIPTINLVVHPDPVRGWNLEIQTTNFPVRIGGWHDRFSQTFRSTVIGVAAAAGNVGNRQNSPQLAMKKT